MQNMSFSCTCTFLFAIYFFSVGMGTCEAQLGTQATKNLVKRVLFPPGHVSYVHTSNVSVAKLV